MTSSESISVKEALARIEKGEALKGVTVDFKNVSVKAIDAFKLSKENIEVPEDIVDYDDSDIAYDPEFDDYDWEQTDIDPLTDLKDRVTVNIEIDKDVKKWIQSNGIELDQLLEKLIQSFYTANQGEK